VDNFEKAHILTGRRLIRLAPNQPSLEDDPEAWREVWRELRDELLDEFVGSRPRAWYEHDCPRNARQRSDETEVQFLHRIGAIDYHELERIREVVLERTEHNREHNPGEWIADDDGLTAFAIEHELLDEAELPFSY
jgi:hypothetical protein